MPVTRSLVSVTPEDHRGWPAGRPMLWGYGLGYICKIAGVRRDSACRAARSYRVDLGDPITVVAWALCKQGHRDLAAQVLAAFGRKKTWGR